MSNKKWILWFITICGILLCGFGAVTVIIDPYFHYHKPLSSLQYPIDNERYQNDGIVKHFEYNAIITGTSMTQNFKASVFDRIFGVDSIKVPFSGASYKEINDNLLIATTCNSDIKLILRGLDYNRLLDTKDEMRYEEEFYPRYLYDNNLCNDVKYVFNKSVLFETTLRVLEYTNGGGAQLRILIAIAIGCKTIHLEKKLWRQGMPDQRKAASKVSFQMKNIKTYVGTSHKM